MSEREIMTYGICEVRILNREELYDRCLSHYIYYDKSATIGDININYFEDNYDDTYECWYNDNYSIPINKNIIEILKDKEVKE